MKHFSFLLPRSSFLGTLAQPSGLALLSKLWRSPRVWRQSTVACDFTLGPDPSIHRIPTLLWGLTPATTAHPTLLWGLTPATTYGFTGPSPASSLTGPSPVSEPVVEPPSFSGSSTVPGSSEVTRFTSSPLRS